MGEGDGAPGLGWRRSHRCRRSVRVGSSQISVEEISIVALVRGGERRRREGGRKVGEDREEERRGWVPPSSRAAPPARRRGRRDHQEEAQTTGETSYPVARMPRMIGLARAVGKSAACVAADGTAEEHQGTGAGEVNARWGGGHRRHARVAGGRPRSLASRSIRSIAPLGALTPPPPTLLMRRKRRCLSSTALTPCLP